ncbi:aldose 1-epimerase [Polaribacter pacificus]|uniref:Aldose 1-epimerase n=1 Tax=Polaribacter pacificus TaxID=1775173 RepID=A0A917HZF1_9FLAO|nr:aldose 1-epimerase family protein [Polaribacter pacificus]GGG97758.1 aldose 1-epimerase [Polaribacter pacificus]
MLHTIENDILICQIESNGAEIRSLKNKMTGEEYIWQIDKTIWGSSSPVLFPAIGKIKSGKVVYKGKSYEMPKHGIVRNNNNLSFKQHGVSKCCFTLKSSVTTLKQYPFKFIFSIEYVLLENRLKMLYHIENKDMVPIFFACGGHTAYACHINDTHKLSDYVIEFPSQLSLKANQLGSSGLLTKNKKNIESIDNTLSLSDTLFNNDALVFSNLSCDWIRLRQKNKRKGIKIHFSDFPNLALWSKPSADFVCIEPWLGLPDQEDESIELTKKTNYKSIEPDTFFSIAIETEIE